MNHIFLPLFIMKHSNMDVIKKNRVRTDLLNSELVKILNSTQLELVDLLNSELIDTTYTINAD
jgi:hypothetical protein